MLNTHTPPWYTTAARSSDGPRTGETLTGGTWSWARAITEAIMEPKRVTVVLQEITCAPPLCAMYAGTIPVVYVSFTLLVCRKNLERVKYMSRRVLAWSRASGFHGSYCGSQAGQYSRKHALASCTGRTCQFIAGGVLIFKLKYTTAACCTYLVRAKYERACVGMKAQNPRPCQHTPAHTLLGRGTCG